MTPKDAVITLLNTGDEAHLAPFSDPTSPTNPTIRDSSWQDDIGRDRTVLSMGTESPEIPIH